MRWRTALHNSNHPSLKQQGREHDVQCQMLLPDFRQLKWNYNKICEWTCGPKMHVLLLFSSIKTLHRIFNPGKPGGLHTWLFFLLPSGPKGANKQRQDELRSIVIKIPGFGLNILLFKRLASWESCERAGR